MAKKQDSPRDKARPTGNMSAEESHEYARDFQKENFGAPINVGSGGDGADAAATTQESIQRERAKVPNTYDDRTEKLDEEKSPQTYKQEHQ